MNIILIISLWFHFSHVAHGADLIQDSIRGDDFLPIATDCFLVAAMTKNHCGLGTELDKRVKACQANQEKFNCQKLKLKDPKAPVLECDPASLCKESLTPSGPLLTAAGCSWSLLATGLALVALPVHFFEFALAQDRKNMDSNITVMEFCSKTNNKESQLKCRQIIVTGNAELEALSSEELMKKNWDDLITQVRKAKFKPNAGLVGKLSEPGVWDRVMEAAKEFLKHEQEVYNCAGALTKQKILCDAALLVAPAVVGGAKWLTKISTKRGPLPIRVEKGTLPESYGRGNQEVPNRPNPEAQTPKAPETKPANTKSGQSALREDADPGMSLPPRTEVNPSAAATATQTKSAKSTKPTKSTKQKDKRGDPSRPPVAQSEMVGAPVENPSPQFYAEHGFPILENLPRSMKVVPYQRGNDSFLVYEKGVRSEAGNQVRKALYELQIDKLTGVVDARYKYGIMFLRDLLMEKKGRASFTFVDINNLGKVNNEFGGSKELGRIAGDKYLRGVVQAMKESVGDKGIVFRLGGDEIGIVWFEKNPKTLREWTNNMIAATNNPTTKQVFLDEKKRLDDLLKNGKITATEHQKQSAYLGPDISAGTVRTAEGESLEEILLRAELGAQRMKVTTKTIRCQDAKKAGGSPQSLDCLPDFSYVPQISEVGPPGTAREVVKGPPIDAKTQTITEARTKELFRFGDTTVAEYKSPETGQSFYRIEIYNSKGQITSMREVVLDAQTGFINGTHESGQFLMKQFIKTGPNHVIGVELKNFGKVNYFKGGKQIGDDFLKATAKVITEIEKTFSKKAFAARMQGGDFLIGLSETDPAAIQAFQKALADSLKNNEEIKAIFARQKAFLEKKLTEQQKLVASSKPNQKAEIDKNIAELKKNLEELIKPEFGIASKSLKPSDDTQKVINELAEATK